MKLTDLTPADFAAHVERRALDLLDTLREQWQRDCDWVGRVGMALSPGYDSGVITPTLHVGERRGGTDLGLTAASLLQYAQTGQGWDDVPSGEADQAQAAEDALLTLLGVLDRHSETHVPEEWVSTQDTDDPLAIVARAALARIALARGGDVQRAWLCALVGVSAQRIRTLIAEGVLDAVAVERGGVERALSPITHASASQWLRARDPSR